jgi:ferric-dicitrate binding protein FerR (iron transport regulator)
MGRKRRTEKITDALNEAASFVHLLRDRKVRSRLRAAIDHAAVASGQVRRDVNRRGTTSRLAQDKKLHRNVRAMVRDLRGARDRMETKRRHRIRKMLLLLGGTGVAAAAVPSSRRWIVDKMGMNGNGTAAGAA